MRDNAVVVITDIGASFCKKILSKNGGKTSMAQELVFFVTEHENGGKTSTDKILTKKKFGKPNERN